MKVALVNNLYVPYQVGGSERSVQTLAEGLSARGHSVSVITLSEAHVDRFSVINGVAVRRLPLENWYWPFSGAPGNRTARAAWKLRDFHNAAMSAHVGRVLDDVRPDILLTHALMGFSVSVWQHASRRRLPIVHTLHDYYLMCPPGGMYRNAANCERICPRCLPFAVYRRQVSRVVDAVVGISRFILNRHIGAGFFAGRRRSKVIYHSLPARHINAAQKRRKDHLVFGFIGRISAEKGLQWLLEVFTRNAHPGQRLVVAGRGEPRFERSLRAKYSLPSVSFIGHVAPAAFYEQVDVVVIPSLWHEPFGRTAMEPLEYGIPVIATNRGGLPEIVQNGVTGIVVEPDGDSLARVMNRLSAEPDLLSRLSTNAAQAFCRFSGGANVDEYAHLLADVVGQAATLGTAAAGARRTTPGPAES